MKDSTIQRWTKRERVGEGERHTDRKKYRDRDLQTETELRERGETRGTQCTCIKPMTYLSINEGHKPWSSMASDIHKHIVFRTTDEQWTAWEGRRQQGEKEKKGETMRVKEKAGIHGRDTKRGVGQVEMDRDKVVEQYVHVHHRQRENTTGASYASPVRSNPLTR